MIRGVNAAQAAVSILLVYCASDIISKCGVGLVIYQVTHSVRGSNSLYCVLAPSYIATRFRAFCIYRSL